MRIIRICLRFSIAILLTFVVPAQAAMAQRDDSEPKSRDAPNIVIILTDDQGYADVGVYGARAFETPHLDRMAAEGMRFTAFYMPTSSCSPSRAALMTGRYPPRNGINHVLGPNSRIGLPSSEVTIAELLKEQGYKTAAVGKWHLGDRPAFLPTRHGFDSYFGLPYSNDMSPNPAHNPREHARKHPPLPLMRDTTIVEREPDQAHLTRRYTEEAVRFIDEHADEPFFLYLAHNMPHVPLHASKAFVGSSREGLYGDVIQEIDWSVGQIRGALKRNGLEEKTLVVFTSDNGPWLIFGNHAGSAGPFREGKATSFEGGHRVPGIFSWPENIPPSTVSDEVVTALDLLPTIASIAGASIPKDRIIDGRDVSPILFGQAEAQVPPAELIYYRSGHPEAVRSGRWKLHIPHPYRTLEGDGHAAMDGAVGRYARGHIDLSLFDLERDSGETTNVAAEHPEVVERLRRLIEQAPSRR